MSSEIENRAGLGSIVFPNMNNPELIRKQPQLLSYVKGQGSDSILE